MHISYMESHLQRLTSVASFSCNLPTCWLQHFKWSVTVLIYSLTLTFYFLIAFTLPTSLNDDYWWRWSCSTNYVSTMFATEFIFCNNPKSIWKIHQPQCYQKESSLPRSAVLLHCTIIVTIIGTVCQTSWMLGSPLQELVAWFIF